VDISEQLGKPGSVLRTQEKAIIAVSCASPPSRSPGQNFLSAVSGPIPELTRYNETEIHPLTPTVVKLQNVEITQKKGRFTGTVIVAWPGISILNPTGALAEAAPVEDGTFRYC
jgi:hypothetical protein